MTSIEKIKHDGALRALAERIDGLRHKLCNHNWDNIRDYNKFTRLDEALSTAACILAEMRDVFDEMKKMDPTNK